MCLKDSVLMMQARQAIKHDQQEREAAWNKATMQEQLVHKVNASSRSHTLHVVQRRTLSTPHSYCIPRQQPRPCVLGSRQTCETRWRT